MTVHGPISKITQLDIKETLTEYCAFTYYLNNVLYLMSLAAVLLWNSGPEGCR